MKRLPDWPARFAALVAQRRACPFGWGAHDCVLWAADDVQALTGIDPAVEWRGTYETALQAERLVRQLGGLVGIAERALGQPIAPLLARVGDVGLVDTEGRELFAVCNGTHWLAPCDRGLATLGLPSARLAWRVGA